MYMIKLISIINQIINHDFDKMQNLLVIIINSKGNKLVNLFEIIIKKVTYQRSMNSLAFLAYLIKVLCN